MRIKRLEIVGFKSFCDRTILHFNQPITSVVGPNGCGKSNIVDAIRWCMGEQSAKYLRGKEMQDVIFAGSDSRGPAGMCEVSLTFENDGRVPLEYLAYSEITVTRRLYRDGTSEYLLNNTPCRLRDVTDFFLGTGIGAKAYSIIEQGRVAMVVTSKPEDRRFLIEEAAGITKYKLKKKAAEKKIESTRQNLLRVTDIVGEIEKQLASLRRAAQKAERFKQYKAEMRDIELWSASQRWLGIHVERQVAAAGLAEAQDAKQAQETALVTREASIEAARLQAADEESRLSQLQERLYELDNKIRLGEAENEHASREAAQLDDRGEQARTDIEQIGRQLAEGAVERERLQAELTDVEAARAADAAGLAEREATHRALREELGRVQRELDGAKGEIARAQTDIARGEQQERGLVKRAEDLEQRLARVSEEAARIGGRAGELDAEVTTLEGRQRELKARQESLVGQRETHEERLAELKDDVQRRERDVETLRKELHQKQARHHSLEEIQAKYEGFARGTRWLMQQKPKEGEGGGEAGGLGWGVRGLVADVVIAPPELEVAVEAALGDRLGSLVVESHDVGMGLLEQLKEKKQGRSVYVPLKPRAGAVPARFVDEDGQAFEGVRGRLIDLVKCDDDYRAMAEALLGDVLVVDDLLRAVDLWRGVPELKGWRLVTVEGDVVDASGVTAGGSREGQGAGVLEQKRQLRELEETIAQLDGKHRAMAGELETLKAEQEELRGALDRLRAEKHQGEIALLAVEKDLQRSRQEMEQSRQRAGSLGRERDDLARQRDEVVREAEEVRLQVRDARDRLAKCEERHSTEGREAVALFERVEAAAADLTEFKVRAGQSQERRAGLGQTLARLDAQLTELGQRRVKLETAIEEGRERAVLLREDIAARKAMLVEASEESTRAGEELRVGRSKYETERADLLRVESELKGMRARLAEVTAAATELELKLRELAMDRARLEEQVEERWRVQLVEQLIDYHSRPPVGDAEAARVVELRDLIERMGEINLTAIDEYKVLEERYNFLLAQKTDLETAIAQLEEAIAQINATSKTRFKEVFDLVNANFQALFPRLFRGGHAHLALTNPDDVLESGIDIVAQPPGKKNATIELLSGGEKALTAVSLVFAIFLVKPSPFCLLDEVDAPLDEANVGRFNDMVRAMTDRSQFIIITHNKRTMEIADTLYGVTMEQPGCSKLVSVNLSTAGKKKAAA